MLIISKFSRLNRISLGRLQIAAYNTPVLWFVPSNGWNQSKFNIRPRCESATSGLKKFSDVSSSVPLNVFQTRPSYISVNNAHAINLVAQDVMKNEFADCLIHKCNILCTFFKTSHQAG